MREHPLAALWPPARIEIVTPRLQLRLPTDEELHALADVAAGGIHGVDEMPFASPWSDASEAELLRGFVAWHWTARAQFEPKRWTLELGVFVDGEPAGCQALMAREFGIRRVVDTGSWLGRAFHGCGLGTEMRQAVLELGFGALGAERALSNAYVDNPSSIRVSEKCGYVQAGEEVLVRRRGERAPGGPSTRQAVSLQFLLLRDRWLDVRRTDIEVRGVDDALLRLVGALE